MLTYLLLDLENVTPTPTQVAAVRGGQVHLWIFRGPKQGKFDAELAEAWQPLGSQVRHIKSTKDGKNALDFLIAYELGRLRQQHEREGITARYVIVSGDGGFESLLAHVATGFSSEAASRVTRTFSLSEAVDSLGTSDQQAVEPTRAVEPAVPVGSPAAQPKKAAGKTLRKSMVADDIDMVVRGLRESPKNRPADRKALEHHAVSLLRNQVTAAVGQAVTAELLKRGWIKLNGKKLEYKLPRVKQAAK